MKVLLLALALSASTDPGLKRAKDQFEFGSYADCAGAVRAWLAVHPAPNDDDGVLAFRLLGVSEYYLGDKSAAKDAFVKLLSHDPDYALDPFYVPPPIVEFFDKVKQDNEAALKPLREEKRKLKEQQRAAEEAQRKLLEGAEPGGGTKTVRIEDHLYLFNWMPFGAGQFQNGESRKGTLVAAGEVFLAAVNLGAVGYHYSVASDPTRKCQHSWPYPGCAHPPYKDSTRSLINTVDWVKYSSAGLFWALYAYGVVDAHLHYVPRIETEITPGKSGAVNLSWEF